MNFDIDGPSWYRLQALRTVNQAIGRVIRHVNDFGIIFLCDDRYTNTTIEISKWMKDRKKIYGRTNICHLVEDVKKFFDHNEARFKTRAYLAGKKRAKKTESIGEALK